MAKNKTTTKVLQPNDCVRALETYLIRVGALMNVIPEVIEYLNETPTKSPNLRDKLVELLENNQEYINEFRQHFDE